jgi:hypothetical protein
MQQLCHAVSYLQDLIGLVNGGLRHNHGLEATAAHTSDETQSAQELKNQSSVQ